MTDNLSRQSDEIEAISSIYENEWNSEDEVHRSYSIRIKEGNNFLTLYVKLPSDYPSEAPPIFQLSAPELNNELKQRITAELNNIYLQNIGETVLFQWIEKIREILQDLCPKVKTESKPHRQTKKNTNVACSTNTVTFPMPQIFHGNTITDRKSVFQGHTVHVTSSEDIKPLLSKLFENKKIANATHNIYAYRIYNRENNTYMQDCEDDGESQAGGRLLHLLQILDVKNALVVVSRWYGGSHLGPERFKHINNAARQVLEEAGFLHQIDNGKKKKN